MTPALLEPEQLLGNKIILNWLFSEKQTIAFDTLEDPTVDELLYGGAKGGGKSVLGCRWLYNQCQKVIQEFDLKPQKYPIPIAFMGRKKGKHFKDTTLETWKKFIHHSLYELKEHDQEIIIDGALKIDYGGLDSQEAIEKFNSAEYAFIFIDQAEETLRDDYGMLKGTLRLKIKGHDLPYKMLLTANPAECYLKQDFITTKSVNKRFIQALPGDNPFLAKTYVDNLKEAFKHRPELLEAYLYGSWDSLEGSNTLIKDLWIRDSVDRELRFNPETRITVCDVGADGDDDTVIYDMEGYEIKNQNISGEKDTMKTAFNIVTQAHKFYSTMITIDTCGLGKGVYDRVKQILGPDTKLSVYALNSAEAPKNEQKAIQFLNVRAEMWWFTAELFANCLTTLPRDEVLIGDLGCATYFEATKGRLQIESKKDIKVRLNRSPDRGDAYVMGCYSQQFAKAKKAFHRTKIKQRGYNGKGMI